MASQHQDGGLQDVLNGLLGFLDSIQRALISFLITIEELTRSIVDGILDSLRQLLNTLKRIAIATWEFALEVGVRLLEINWQLLKIFLIFLPSITVTILGIYFRNWWLTITGGVITAILTIVAINAVLINLRMRGAFRVDNTRRVSEEDDFTIHRM